MEKMPISSNMEDYLEAISEIVETNGHAHTKDIAARMKVKMPSVTNALQALASRGLIRYQSHAPVVLTQEGAQAAAVIRHRHGELRRFFHDILKIDMVEADEAACRMEHLVNDRVMSRFVALAEAILEREDCAGLRAYLNESMPQISSGMEEELSPMNQLGEDEAGVIVKVAESLRGVRRFADLGLLPGTEVTIAGYAPFGDLIRIKVLGSSLSLRSSDAGYIWVRPVGKK